MMNPKNMWLQGGFSSDLTQLCRCSVRVSGLKQCTLINAQTSLINKGYILLNRAKQTDAHYFTKLHCSAIYCLVNPWFTNANRKLDA